MTQNNIYILLKFLVPCNCDIVLTCDIFFSYLNFLGTSSALKKRSTKFKLVNFCELGLLGCSHGMSWNTHNLQVCICVTCKLVCMCMYSTLIQNC